ncbi:MAG: S8 family serine peptidase [Planctomycetota bacterium]
MQVQGSPLGEGRRPRRSRGALYALGAIGCFCLLSRALPDTAPAPVVASTAAGAHADEHGAGCPGEQEHGEEGHGAPGHTCGLDTKAMLSRFRHAIDQVKGREHRVVDVEGIPSIAGQVLVGWSGSGAEIDALAARLDAKVLRLGRDHAVLSRERDVAGLLVALRAEPAVRFAEPNAVARCALVPNDPFFQVTGNKNAGLERAWDITTGIQSVVVAVLDTGADTAHPDLANRLVPGFDFVNNTATMSDDNGHGTAMCGIVAAEGQNNLGVAGVAMNARVMPVKVADSQGQASVADVVAGIDYAIQQNARVINLSLGAPVGSAVLEAAVNRALTAGVVVVASAGNDPVHHEVFPAAYPGVISATALQPDGKLGYDAVLAEGVEVGAPGEKVVTTLPGDVYGFVTGSSAAAAFTSGVAALVASRQTTLTGDQIGNILKNAQRPIPELKAAGTTYRFGQLDAELAVLRADATYVDIAVTDLSVYPQKPIPGANASVVIEVSNEGNTALTNRVIRVERILAGSGSRIEIGFQVIDLTVGERRKLTYPFVAPPAGNYVIRAIASTPPGETETADNELGTNTTIAPGAQADLRVVARRITSPTAPSGTVGVEVEVENRGTADALNVAVQADVSAAGPVATAPAAVIPAAAGGLGVQTIPVLAVGQRATVQFTYTIPAAPPVAIQRLRVHATPLAGEQVVFDNTAFLDFLVGTQTTLHGLYQQSNGVDVIHDAPWRVAPNRPYVPLQVFVPSKGGRTNTTKLRVARTTIAVGDAATGPWQNLYTDTHGAAPTAPAGLEIADERGNLRGSGLDLFGGQDLDQNGRHEIFHMPRAAFGVAATPAPGVDKYVEMDMEWEQHRVVLWVFSKTSNGHHRGVMKVHFAADDLPELPGDNHYHDVHHHTIAEWYFGSPLDIFAPRKAYGGPLQMVFETAWSLGITPGPTAADAYMKIITTDHSSFNNRTIPDPDGADHRPPFGPQSVGAQPGTTQLDAFRTIFGKTANEEVAFKQDVPLPRIPFLNKILNLLPGIPLGAHMLLYNADHVEGPWHGGGWLKGPGNPNINVDLFPLLNDVAKNRQATQGESFAYAAHPYSGQGWNPANYERAFGLDPALRTRDEVHDQSNEFVIKGLEFFNGRGTRSLPTSQIDFNDLNPWTDPDFQRGSDDWDKGLWDGMTLWHEALSKTLDYSFVSDPEVRFIRKLYQAGGSDAHGDFNFSVGRAATPLSLQMTYNVGDEAWYKVRTYCFGDGKPGASAGDRWFAAYADGNSVTTDGPLATFELDAEPRFDGANLRWHDQARRVEDPDGRIGGAGPLDGGFTALVERGSLAPTFRYYYTSNAEFGPIASLLLYKTEAGNRNPARNRPSGFAGLSSYDQITGVNELSLNGAGTWHEHALDAAKEGPITKNTALALGAYTRGNPDQMDLGPDAFRCWTNPIFCVPYDVTVDAGAAVNGVLPAGAMTVTFRFDVSMDARAYALEVQALDASGDSLLGSPVSTLVPTTGSGWGDQPGIKSSVLTLTNQDALPLGGDEYPAASGEVRFVLYFRDAPRDYAGNELNRIAKTFGVTRVPGAPAPGGGTGTGSTASPVTSSVGTTAPGSTAAPSASSGGGSHTTGLCSLETDSLGSGGEGGAPLSLLLVFAALLGLRLRRGAP